MPRVSFPSVPLRMLFLMLGAVLVPGLMVEAGDGPDTGSDLNANTEWTLEEKVALYAAGEHPSQPPADLKQALPRSPAKP